MRYNRRDILSTAAVFGMGGLVGGVSGWVGGENSGYGNGYDEGYEEGWNTIIRRGGGFNTTTNDSRLQHIEHTRTVNADDHHHINFEIEDREALLQYIGFADDHLDFILMPAEEYAEYNDGDDDHGGSMMLFSKMDTTRAIVQRDIQPGEYELVVDNTTVGRAVGANAGVEYSIQIDIHQREDKGMR